MASALLVDYVLTVAVSVSSGVQNAAHRARRSCAATRSIVAVGLVVLLTAMNLRGVRESGKAFAVPSTLFMLGIIGMGVVGFVQAVHRHACPRPRAPSSSSCPSRDHEAIGRLALPSCCCAPSPPAARP